MKRLLVGSISTLGLASVLLVQCSRNGYEPEANQASAERPYDPTGPETRRAEQVRAAEGAADEHAEEDKGRATERRPNEERAADRPRFIGGGPRDLEGGMSSSSAILSIAAARCDREARCDRIGPDGKFGTRRDCLTNARSDERTSAPGDACRGGLSPERLDECLQSIRSEDCRNPLTDVTRLQACRAANLCAR